MGTKRTDPHILECLRQRITSACIQFYLYSFVVLSGESCMFPFVNGNLFGVGGQAVGGRDFCIRHNFFFPLCVKILCVHLLIPHMLLL